MTGLPFSITYDSQGFYLVSRPNYEGGEVVTVEDANAAISAAVAAEREANREPLEDAAQQLRAVAAYANSLPKRYAIELSSMIRYGEIEAAAIRARSNGAKGGRPKKDAEQ